MKCPKCQVDNADGIKFCGQCGAKLERICPQCTFPNPSDFKFCGQCGHDLITLAPPLDPSKPHSYTPKFLADKILTTRSSVEGERKLVTVFFADVANFTTISEKLDPEEIHGIMDGCFKILMDEIHRYEGSINQFTGDGVMALFGAPLAHEDHAIRACHASLSIQHALANYGEKLKKTCGIDFRMRIGLNSGPVVVGAIGDDLRMDYTAIGDTINLASRMESAAQPGAILVSGHTQRLARDFFTFSSLGPIQVKGKEEPQDAYELMETSEVRTRLEASAVAGLTRFVGRHKETETLHDALDKARSGQGQVVGIVGEAGVGKSRIILEMRHLFPEYTYLEGRCLHYGGAMAYLPLLDILRSYFEIKEGEREYLINKKMKEKLTSLDATLISPFQDLLSLEPDQAYLKLEPKEKRERIFEALRDLFVRESEKRPLVLIIEDLHWVDKTSEEFLDYLIDWLATAPIVLILLYRPEYSHRWGNKSYYTNIRVDQLSLSTSSELVQSILSEGEIVSELRDLILGKAAGNPFFMEELTYSLLENGSIQKKDHQYFLSRSLSDIQVPDTIQGIIAARIDRLDESLKRIMHVASVIGREFAFRILQAIMEMKEELKSRLLNLQGLEFIYEKRLFPELEYIFKHALTQEVAYNSLLLKRRKEIHEKVGGTIEEIYPDRLEEFYEMLAHHYSKSENLDKAYEYLKLCGNKAMRRYSDSEAIHFYKGAVGILKEKPDTEPNKKERVDIILLMAIPMARSGYPADSLTFLEECEGLCRELGDQKSLAILHSLMGALYAAKGDAALGMKYQEEALEEAEKIHDIEMIGRMGFNLCWSFDVASEYRKIVDIAPRVIFVLEKSQVDSDVSGTFAELYSLQGIYGHALGYIGRFAEGAQICEAALSLAQKTGNLYTIGYAEFLCGCLLSCKGDGEGSVRHIQTAIGYLEKSHVGFKLPFFWTMLGLGYYLSEDLGKASEILEKGLKMQVDSGLSFFLGIPHLGLSWVNFDLGNLEEARLHADEALKLGQANHEKGVEGIAWCFLGRVIGKMDGPRIDEAEDYILRGMKICDELEMKPFYAQGHLFLGELYAHADQKEKALENLKKAETMFQEMGMDYWLARTRRISAGL